MSDVAAFEQIEGRYSLNDLVPLAGEASRFLASDPSGCESSQLPHPKFSIKIKYLAGALAGVEEVAAPQGVNDLDCQTALTAPIEHKRLFGRLLNRTAHAPAQACVTRPGGSLTTPRIYAHVGRLRVAALRVPPAISIAIPAKENADVDAPALSNPKGIHCASNKYASRPNGASPPF